MKFSRSATLLLTALAAAANQGVVVAFVPLPASSHKGVALLSSSSSETAANAATSSSNGDGEDDPLGLTAELRKLTSAFENIGDDKLRYKQLLYMSSNGLEVMPEELKTEENKVLGCLSTVHVHATPSLEGDRTVIHFKGDSDGLLTKGLVALLVRGLDGNTAEDIQKVDPNFIKTAGIAQSLTPGRNNGFLNMLALMKRKAAEAGSAEPSAASNGDSSETTESAANPDEDPNRPFYNAIMTALTQLQPTHLELTDNSQAHAGHAGNTGDGTESHFQLEIVADAFEGLHLVKRHQLIYMMLGEVMPKIHALEIQALTPEEAAKN